MFYQVVAIMIMIVFYTFYFAKYFIQKKQSIKTNQMGVGNKSKKVLMIERIMSAATMSTVAFEVGSILLMKSYLSEGVRIAGMVIGVVAILFFAAATITMKNSWRVGIPEEKTSLITEGIYSFSRNPAFVSFDLLYLSVCLMFFNVPLLLVSVWAAVMLHLQILQEEEHMLKMFGQEYAEYKKRTMRYLGRK
ncbi:MAG: isoprenylcysteine carboxylmethyltransferase family protein [Lachnospiraceae bacterium]|nr:isoprenylcysteine carboxylmethyltransferase family protein [Lachnospiraceae bacterium]